MCRYIRCHWDRALREGVCVGTYVVIGIEHPGDVLSQIPVTHSLDVVSTVD